MSTNSFLDQMREVETQAMLDFDHIKGLEDLEQFFQTYLGKKGSISQLLKGLKAFSPEEKKEVAPKIQALKQRFDADFISRRDQLEAEALAAKLAADWIDVTKSHPKQIGNLHPISKVQKQIEDIFLGMGFEVADGPEVETEWHNFDALNIPPTHPARDMQDTFFVKTGDDDSLNNSVLRTHTSNLQVRSMLEHGAPLRLIAPGRVFRNEELDATHDATFYQFECLLIDEGINISHLKGVLDTFLEQFFEYPVKTRYRPGYFPFVEPGFEVDIWFEPEGKKGKWLELLGAGMVHPNVLKAGKIDTAKHQGFAFGLGLTRLAMMKYGIDDIRLLASPKSDFLSQF